MKIVSQNFCLGLINKIDMARIWTRKLNMDIFIIQEAELPCLFDEGCVAIKNFTLHRSSCGQHSKSRLAIYTRTNLQCKVTFSNRAEIALVRNDNISIFALYRPFKTILTSVEYINELSAFVRENSAPRDKIIIVGDINLDYLKRNDETYPNYKASCQWQSLIDDLSLIQMIKTPTWKRVINNEIKESLLDHAYVYDESINCQTMDLSIGDHMSIIIQTKTTRNPNAEIKEPIYIRSWKPYSKEKLQSELSKKDLSILDSATVEEHAFELSRILTDALETIAPEKLIH
jgi:hypothetical protein